MTGDIAAPVRAVGQSDEAGQLLEMDQEIRVHARIRAAFADLVAACAAADQDGWDGDGASALDPASYFLAESLLQSLLVSFPVPEFTVDPDGEVTFDWMFGPGCALTLSISGAGRITYAWMDGRRRAGGTEWFNGATPATLALALAELSRNAAH